MPASKRIALWVVLGLMLLAIGGYIAWSTQHEQYLAEQRVACEKYASLRNVGVAYLEDGNSVQAEEPLAELTKLLPNDPVGVRNLVISRMLIGVKLPDGTERAPSDPFPAAWYPPLEELQKVEPQAVSTAFLTAHFYQELLHQPKDALVVWEQAAQLAPEDMVIQWSIYELLKNNAFTLTEPEYAVKARAALDRLYALDPKSLPVLLERMVVQAEAKEPALAETIKAFRPTVQPVVESIKRGGNDVEKYLTEAEVKLKAGDWQGVLGAVSRVGFLTKPQEWAQSDLRRLRRHPLAYVVHEFLPATCAADLFAGQPETPPIPVTFVDRPGPAEAAAAPVVALNLSDFDQNGTPDLIAVSKSQLVVHALAIDGKGTWSKLCAVEPLPGIRGLLVADLDRDNKIPGAAAVPAGPEVTKVRTGNCQVGDVDVVVYGDSGVQVFRNELADGQRTLTPVGQSAEFQALRGVETAALADVDHDGDLDLVLSTADGMAVWADVGKTASGAAPQYADISARSAMPPKDFKPVSLVAVDWDRDIDLDILAVGSGQIGWLENLRHGGLRWVPFTGPLNDLRSATCMQLLDIDGNLSWDLLGFCPDAVRLVTTRTVPANAPEPLKSTVVTYTPYSQGRLWDYDNDGRLDFVAWSDAGPATEKRVGTIWRGRSGNRFEVLPALWNSQENLQAVAAADIDNDGDLDLIGRSSKGLFGAQNRGGNENKWLAIRAQGETEDKQGGDVNHLGIGSLIEVQSGVKYQAQVVTGQITHFGMGEREAEAARIVWTNGIPQPAVMPGSNQTICRIHDPKGSCPYLYTWTGSKYEFCTDACWAAPLGLQFADGIFAKPRAWEYLLIPGGRMALKDGRYSMQMTEELWEATYLDRTELIAVDHPADVNIVSNEKVGSGELAAFKVHTRRSPRLPVAARDKFGNDVLPILRDEDEQYLRGFKTWEGQGVVEDHFLELDLGKLEDPKTITLFLTGWMFPIPTSLNINLTQESHAPVMKPPSLWVPDAQGEWQEVRPFMGFPGGKTKTIAVDLSGIFPAKDYRLRIMTNMEIYWDAVNFTVDEQPADVKLTHLPIAKADLHSRGFSDIRYPENFGPHRYAYDKVTTEMKWPTMRGMFTRFGDVTELVQDEDDCMVIFGAGDELTLEFAPPADPPPPGWKRDFLLYNSGWDKDCDLNVVYSQDVEPLPFQAMSGYPYRADEQYPDSEKHRAYLKKYQTRTQNAADFWRVLARPAKADTALGETTP